MWHRKIAVGLIVAAIVVIAASVAITHAQAPGLSDLEQLRRENLALMSQLVSSLSDASKCHDEANQRQVAQRADQVKQDIEKAHPGYRFDVATGTLTPNLPDPISEKAR